MARASLARVTEDTDEFVIEELARRTGLTVRSIRSYQTRKLLPPPSLRSRTGYYGEHHVARIELIKDLQSQGLKLTSIARLLDNQSGADADLLRFSRTVSTLFGERPEVLTTAADLQRRFAVADDQAPAVLGKAIELGLLRDLGDGLMEEVSPRLLTAGERAMETLGLDVHGALRALEQLQRQAQAVATTYIDLFTDKVWTPFAEAGRPHDQWPEIEAALGEVRILATEALVSSFELVMSAEVNKVFDREIARPRSSRSRRHGRSRS
jgi:DNA-binding transcriptional MerR regulator